MIVKKYLVSSMNEAMNKIRYELGRDAVIINQRKVRRRGFKGLFSPKMLEVTAAIDSKKSNNKPMQDSIHAIKKVLEKKEVLPKEAVFSKLDNTMQENNALIKEKIGRAHV